MEFSSRFSVPVARPANPVAPNAAMPTPGVSRVENRFATLSGAPAPVARQAAPGTVPLSNAMRLAGPAPAGKNDVHRTMRSLARVLAQAAAEEAGSLPADVPAGPAQPPAAVSRREGLVRTVSGVVESLRAEMVDFVKNEFDPTVEAPNSNTVLAGRMSDGEILAQMLLELDSLDDLATRLEDGVAGSYLSAHDREVLAGLHDLARDRRGGVKVARTAPIQDDALVLSVTHLEDRVGPLRDLVDDVERMVVSSEGASVNVLEPAERSGDGWKTVGVLAVVALLGYGIYKLVEG